jgi:hypothetical protein
MMPSPTRVAECSQYGCSNVDVAMTYAGSPPVYGDGGDGDGGDVGGWSRISYGMGMAMSDVDEETPPVSTGDVPQLVTESSKDKKTLRQIRRERTLQLGRRSRRGVHPMATARDSRHSSSVARPSRGSGGVDALWVLSSDDARVSRLKSTLSQREKLAVTTTAEGDDEPPPPRGGGGGGSGSGDGARPSAQRVSFSAHVQITRRSSSSSEGHAANDDPLFLTEWGGGLRHHTECVVENPLFPGPPLPPPRPPPRPARHETVTQGKEATHVRLTEARSITPMSWRGMAPSGGAESGGVPARCHEVVAWGRHLTSFEPSTHQAASKTKLSSLLPGSVEPHSRHDRPEAGAAGANNPHDGSSFPYAYLRCALDRHNHELLTSAGHIQVHKGSEAGLRYHFQCPREYRPIHAPSVQQLRHHALGLQNGGGEGKGEGGPSRQSAGHGGGSGNSSSSTPLASARAGCGDSVHGQQPLADSGHGHAVWAFTRLLYHAVYDWRADVRFPKVIVAIFVKNVFECSVQLVAIPHIIDTIIPCVPASVCSAYSRPTCTRACVWTEIVPEMELNASDSCLE